MVAAKNRKTEPLCKFGPGGEFIAFWQPVRTESSGSSNCFVKLLSLLVDGLAILVGLRCSGPSVQLENASTSKRCTICHKEKVENALRSNKAPPSARRGGRRVDPASTAATADGGLFGRDAMLLPDYGGAGLRIRHKPKHRVRAYRRTAKKRPAVRLCEQGTLFELDFKSARTA